MSSLLLVFSALSILSTVPFSGDAAACNDTGVATDTSVALCTSFPGVGVIASWLTSPNSAYQAQLSLMPVQNHSVCWLQIAYKATGGIPSDDVGNCNVWGTNQNFRCGISWRSKCIENPANVNCTAVLTNEGDLALESGAAVKWDSDTGGKGGTSIRLNNAGHLEIVDPKNNTVWSSDSVDSEKTPHELDDCVRIDENHASLPLPSPLLLLCILFMLSLVGF